MTTYKARDYQQLCHDKTIAYIKKNTAPVLLKLATGGGKSVIVSMIAQTIAGLAPNKKILCIAPSRELVEQNAEKYAATGSPYSIFCASAGSKCLREQVIFASPQSLLKSAEKVARVGVSAIIVDEAHGMTKTVKSLITAITEYEIGGEKINSKCRVIGMTATPYRTGEGYIYAIDATGEEEQILDSSQAKDPYFHKLIFDKTTEQLIEGGFLTPVITEPDLAAYDTSGLQIERGKFTADSIRLTFESDPTKTELILKEVIKHSQNRRGVIIFASTITHAKTILKMLLTAGQAAEIITGESEYKPQRARTIQLFKSQIIKFIVNVDILTTGFDAPHIDLVVIMRATESAGLLQQMIGRGLRLSPGKEDCLLLDYAENIERHSLQVNLFEPEIRAKADPKEGEVIDFYCPNCAILLQSKRRSDPRFDGLEHDSHGYFLLPNSSERLTMLVKDPTKKDDFGEFGHIELPIPAHFMRRCPNPELYKSMGKPYPCGHRFSLKICEFCGADNDIAARQCCKCREPLIDVNEKLTIEAGKVARIKNEFIACHGMKAEQYKSSAGNYSLKFTFKTDAGDLFAYVTKKKPWLLKPLASASSYFIDINFLPDNYENAHIFDRAPLRVKVRKEGKFLAVVGVSYEKE